MVNVPILYPLKTPENLWFSGVFRWYKIGTLARNGLIGVFVLLPKLGELPNSELFGPS